jgi:glucose/arabinose dehydrogenase
MKSGGYGMNNWKIINLTIMFTVILTVLLATVSCGTGAESPQAASPVVETQEVESPAVETPEMEEPEVETPEVETQEVKTPEVESPDEETTETVILDGELLVQERCTKCHSLERVENAMKTEAEWDENVKRMVGKGAELNAEEQVAVIKFLAEAYPT